MLLGALFPKACTLQTSYYLYIRTTLISGICTFVLMCGFGGIIVNIIDLLSFVSVHEGSIMLKAVKQYPPLFTNYMFSCV